MTDTLLSQLVGERPLPGGPETLPREQVRSYS